MSETGGGKSPPPRKLLLRLLPAGLSSPPIYRGLWAAGGPAYRQAGSAAPPGRCCPPPWLLPPPPPQCFKACPARSSLPIAAWIYFCTPISYREGRAFVRGWAVPCPWGSWMCRWPPGSEQNCQSLPPLGTAWQQPPRCAYGVTPKCQDKQDCTSLRGESILIGKPSRGGDPRGLGPGAGALISREMMHLLRASSLPPFLPLSQHLPCQKQMQPDRARLLL